MNSIFRLLFSVIKETLNLILYLIVEHFHSNPWDHNWWWQFSSSSERWIEAWRWFEKVTVIDADSCRMTMRWMLFPFRKEVWCCERLAVQARRWCRAPSGAVVSQVPCRNAFTTTQTCSRESMTDPSAPQWAVCVCACVCVCLGVDECVDMVCPNKNYKKQLFEDVKYIDLVSHGKHSF